MLALSIFRGFEHMHMLTPSLKQQSKRASARIQPKIHCLLSFAELVCSNKFWLFGGNFGVRLYKHKAERDFNFLSYMGEECFRSCECTRVELTYNKSIHYRRKC